MKVRLFVVCQLSSLFAAMLMAQSPQPIGTVGMQDAKVAGALEVSNGRAILVGSSMVTARDRVAEVSLNRGGTVRVCATSGLHMTAGRSSDGADPLILALDRGAIEVQMAATTHDVVTTPDLRFTMRGDGPLDLRLRVTRNGDTCVESLGEKAPVLNVADQFGEATYELKAGQHVLFEHGSLKEVVDHESSACGCPPEEQTMSVADALVNSGAPGGTATEKTAAEQHPFPAAVSAGLAPATVPQAPTGAVHNEVSAVLSSGGGADSSAEPVAAKDSASGEAKSTVGVAPATAQGPPKPSKDLVHVVGRFFRRLFGGG